MPAPITGFLQGGFGLMIIMLVAVGLSTALYYPFFKAADAAALKEEKGETAE
jgi:cellobiose-specific phosphotransferase system component IIC